MAMEFTGDASGTESATESTEGLVGRAETLRREGQPGEALALLRDGLLREPANLLMKLALARVHLALGENDALRELLEETLAGVGGAPELQAPAEPALAPGVEIDEAQEEPSAPFSLDSPFANPTMARLLEEQGHADEADALREVIAPVEASPGEVDEVFAVAGEPEEDAREKAILETLSSWLDNIQRGAA